MGAIGLALAMGCGTRLAAKSEVTIDETLKWIEKHRADFRAEWHTTEGPTKWQPDDFKNYSGMRDWYWERTIRWTSRSDCPRFNKGLDADGETYSVSRSVSLVGNETDVSEQEATKDATYTRQIGASYTWRLKISQILPDPVVMDYREYLQRTKQVDNQSVDVGSYYYVCILPKPGSDQDAMVEIGDDERVDDGRGNISTEKGYKDAVSIAGIATVQDRKMAERLANAVSHLISLLQNQNQKQPKEPF